MDSNISKFPHLSVLIFCIITGVAGFFLYDHLMLKKISSDKASVILRMIVETQNTLNKKVESKQKGKNRQQQKWNKIIIDIDKIVEKVSRVEFKNDKDRIDIINNISAIKESIINRYIHEANNLTEINTKLYELKQKVSDAYEEIYLKKDGEPYLKFFSLESIIRILKEHLTWPLIGLLIIFYLLFSKNAPDRIAKIFSPFKSIKMGGTEFVLDKSETQQLRKNLEKTITETREEVRRKFDNAVYVYKVNDLFIDTVKEFIKNVRMRDINFSKFRYTIHVPDILFQDKLYQLLDYYNGEGSIKGTTHPHRFGILGRSWRLRKSQFDSDVPLDEEELIKKWGMTREEANRAGKGRKIFMCVLLKNQEDSPIGIMYSDTDQTIEKDVFAAQGVRNEIEKEFLKIAAEKKMLIELENLNREMREYNVLLKMTNT